MTIPNRISIRKIHLSICVMIEKHINVSCPPASISGGTLSCRQVHFCHCTDEKAQTQAA